MGTGKTSLSYSTSILLLLFLSLRELGCPSYAALGQISKRLEHAWSNFTHLCKGVHAGVFLLPFPIVEAILHGYLNEITATCNFMAILIRK